MSVGRARRLGRLGEPSILTPIVAEPWLIGPFWYEFDEFGASACHRGFHSIERIMEFGRLVVPTERARGLSSSSTWRTNMESRLGFVPRIVSLRAVVGHLSVSC